MQTRTRRQKEVLEFITRYIEANGSEPSYQMIARALNLRSKAGIAKHIQALEDQGLLTKRRENGSFSLGINSASSAISGVCEIEWLEAPGDDKFHEEWEKAPLMVPKFMLGIYPAHKVGAFTVTDDGMADRGICEGDIALIETRHFVRDGECIAAVVNGENSMLRGHYRDGGRIELRPSSERFESITLAADRVEILGVYRGLLRPIS
jgi:repressor LexA